VVPVVECPVHTARGNRIAFALAGELSRARVSAAGSRLDGVLRHLIVRTTADDREAMAMLVVTRNDRALRRPIRAFLAGPDRPTSFFLNIHPRPGPLLIGPDTLRLDGPGHVRETMAGLGFLLSPTAFFQTNPAAAETLVQLVSAYAGDTPQRVLDLYAGSGLFALPLVSRGHHVTAVEAHDAAVADAERNVRLNRLPADRLQYVRSSVEHALPRLRREAFDLVVLDPPRGGCHPEVLSAVLRDLAPPRAVYVSCDPDALARDLVVVRAAGYRITRVQPVDMFPHTTHVEAVVMMTRTSAG
jgi:23S rRNA (uracil1939-C5)-methyltransferase